MRRLLLAVLTLSFAFAAPATADAPPTAGAAAKGKAVVLPVTMDWRIAQHSVSACSSWGLATWPEQKGAIGWELRYRVGDQEASKHLSPPFDDEKFKQYGWSPAKGMHWHGLSYSGGSHLGGAPVSCDAFQARQKALVSDVRIAIDIAADATIAGVVKAPDGSPLPGVRVRAGGHGARTGADGRYEIDVPEKARTYRVRASKAGLTIRPRSRRVAVRPGRTSRASFRALGHVILVRVTRDCPDAVSSDDDGEQQCEPWVKGARATAVKVGGGRIVAARTGRDGTAVIIVEEAGRYRVKISHDGKTWRDPVSVTSRKVTVTRNISRSGAGLFVR